MIVISTWSDTALQTPAGSSVVKVNVTEPAVISAADGVYVAFNVALSGLKVPVPPLHVPLVALPLTDPASVTAGASEQTVWSTPALETAGGLTVTVAVLLLVIALLHVQPTKVILVIVRSDEGPVKVIVLNVPVCVVPAVKAIVAVLPVVLGFVVL